MQFRHLEVHRAFASRRQYPVKAESERDGVACARRPASLDDLVGAGEQA
jgi:hypothetical protein